MKEKLAASVILYNPQPSTWKNIMTYLPFVDKLYVLDNSPQSYENELIAVLKDFYKIEYISKNENLGISIQLNIACKKAITDGYEWLLTMDQDSSFSNNDLETYFTTIKNHKVSNIGVWGVNYENQSSSNPTTEIIELDYTITSGSILNLSCYKKSKGFDENLFIDSVDVDYCFQVKNNQWQILQLNNIHLHHQLGTQTKIAILNTKRVLHNPTRLYYMVRNYFYIKEKYKNQYLHYFKLLKTDLLIRIKNNILFGNQKIKTIQSIIKGYQDFKKNKMGRINA